MFPLITILKASHKTESETYKWSQPGNPQGSLLITNVSINAPTSSKSTNNLEAWSVIPSPNFPRTYRSSWPCVWCQISTFPSGLCNMFLSRFGSEHCVLFLVDNGFLSLIRDLWLFLFYQSLWYSLSLSTTLFIISNKTFVYKCCHILSKTLVFYRKKVEVGLYFGLKRIFLKWRY